MTKAMRALLLVLSRSQTSEAVNVHSSAARCRLGRPNWQSEDEHIRWSAMQSFSDVKFSSKQRDSDEMRSILYVITVLFTEHGWISVVPEVKTSQVG
jgi:hypothetical protein